MFISNIFKYPRLLDIFYLCTPWLDNRYAYCPVYYLHVYDKLCIVYWWCPVKFWYLHISAVKWLFICMSGGGTADKIMRDHHGQDGGRTSEEQVAYIHTLASFIYRASLAFADTSNWSRRRRRWRIRSRSTRRLSSRSFGFCQSKITRAKTFKCKNCFTDTLRNLDQQLFNKANEIQEEISRKR